MMLDNGSISRADLEFILDNLNAPYRRVCIWQGEIAEGVVRKLYAIDCGNFLFIERIDPLGGGIESFFILDITPSIAYDLQQWNVAPGVEVNLASYGMDGVHHRGHTIASGQTVIDTVLVEGVYRPE